MSELMRAIPFDKLVNWTLQEYKNEGSIFSIKKESFYKNESGSYMEIFGEKISSPVGPAAGPHSQLAQNIVASYLAGGRFMELKTVQIMDGEELRKCISRPCINAMDEGYNVEWSTEFTVPEAYDEYVKAWFLAHVLGKELGISNTRDFAFNMSVGYDLAGIKSEKINTYIDGMINASNTPIWNECKNYLLDNIHLFKSFTKEDLENISPAISPSITISTLHGCPPDEIERIASYLITEKKIHTYIKCNPTILGYEFARSTLDKMGYEYLSFDDHHFKADLQFEDAIPLMKRMEKLASDLSLSFGVKITNTFPVNIKKGELPGEEMYMSGRSLFPLSINVALLLSKEFDGRLPISYSGGADYFNIERLFNTGIMPITVATTLLKPGGYERLDQIANTCEPLLKGEFKGINVEALTKLAHDIVTDKYHVKDARQVASLKSNSKLGLFDCYIAPCKESGCPIGQQIPEYVNLTGEGKFDEAFKVIAIDNALPAITGAICDHKCQTKCVRTDYEKPISIRKAKSIAVHNSQDAFIKNMVKSPLKTDAKVVVIGAGPAGVAVSYFLRRNGVDVTVLEKRDRPMGIVEFVIPEFRVSEDLINKDFEMAKTSGVSFVFNVDENYSIEELKKQYDFVIIATGAWKEGVSPVKTGSDKIIDALKFLENSKENNCKIDLGKRVAIIGGGDVAMDCSRAAKRGKDVEEVCIVYRRTKEFMPAEFEEIELAINDGVKFMELFAPVSYDGKTLVCEVQELSEERDASGRKKIVGTGKIQELAFDTVIGAVGARVDTDLFVKNAIELDKYNSPKVDNSNETRISGVYIAGDCKKGAATIVKAVADGKIIAKDILDKLGLANDFVKVQINQPAKDIYKRKSMLIDPSQTGRCLSCDQICEVCVSVCPNRANVSIKVNAKEFTTDSQILHIDGMCNECGNCGVFCPHQGNPYKDKITLFWTEHDFEDSTNAGFLQTSDDTFKVRTENGDIVDYKVGNKNISKEIITIIDTVINDYYFYLNR